MTPDQIYSLIFAIFFFIIFIVLLSNAIWYSKITGKDAISTSQANTLRWVNGILAFLVIILFVLALIRVFTTKQQRGALYNEYLIKD
jgi:formate hydrogenlyase subunit 3/multisubunit Na+/H+ antiporter MnhD subunit